MSKTYPYHDEEWLLGALGEQSVGEIADECDVTVDTIERWIDKHGIVHEREQPVDEGEEVPRENIDSDDLEQDAETVHTQSEKASARTIDKSLPEGAEVIDEDECECCGYVHRLCNHTVMAGDIVQVCAACEDRLRGLTPNAKRSVLNNPIINPGKPDGE